MGFLSFGRRPKPKPFGFKPRYYDEEKEELQQRLKRMNNPDDVSMSKERIKSGLRASYRGDAQYKKAETRKANIRLLMIIVALVLAALLFLRSSTLADLLRSIEG